jgi:hypothetical protein
MPSRVFSMRPTRIHRPARELWELAVDAGAWSGKGGNFVCASVAWRPGCVGAPLLLAAGSVDPRPLVEILSCLPADRIESEPDAVLHEALRGTPLTAGLVLWPRVHLVHAGDLRGYHLRRGELREATTAFSLDPGDALLFVTDGLSAALGGDELAEIASRPCSAHAVCHMLVEAARSKGAPDDATAAFVRFGIPL